MPSSENTRLAKNTIFLYFRMILVMGVTLFTSRVILNALGVNDYGIYNVVGGMVSLFSVISGSLSSAISRFITFELGTGNFEKLKQIFSTAMSIQIILSILCLIIGGSLGFWFLNTKMNIASERIYSANWVLFFSIITFIISLLSVPYNAEIIAHEKMKTFAYVGIIEVMLKLGVAYLIYAFKEDKLIFYSLLMAGVSLILRIIYGIYCSKHFEECKTSFKFNKKIFKEMSGFAGWNFIGTASTVIRDQGNNIILNLFLGTVVNAAYSIGMQVSNAAYSFSQNFMTAINPQITKTFAQNNHDKLISLIYRGSRFSFFLLWIIALVLLFNTKMIITLWLKEVPEYTVTFVRLFLIFVLSESISQPLITSQLASGKIKNYQICVGGSKFLNLPISYLLLKLGFSPYVTVIVAIIISIGMLFMRFYFLKGILGLKIKFFILNSLVPIIYVTTFSLILSYFSIFKLPDNLGFLFIKSAIILIIGTLSIYILGCTKFEREYINSKIHSLFNK